MAWDMFSSGDSCSRPPGCRLARHDLLRTRAILRADAPVGQERREDRMKLQGQAALVTGGGSGIGADVARHLAKAGAKVAVLDVNMAGAEAVATEIGGLAVECDVASA